MNKTSAWTWLNPLTWIRQVYALFTTLITDILKLFGLAPPPATSGFDNIQAADVEDAATAAVEKEVLTDTLLQQSSPAEIVHAYAVATEEQRATVDLGKLSPREQDWLLGLSETDLVLLGAAGIATCARSLRACAVATSARRLRGRDNGKPEPDNALPPREDDREAGNRAYINARFRQLISAPTRSDASHEPVSLWRH